MLGAAILSSSSAAVFAEDAANDVQINALSAYTSTLCTINSTITDLPENVTAEELAESVTNAASGVSVQNAAGTVISGKTPVTKGCILVIDGNKFVVGELIRNSFENPYGFFSGSQKFDIKYNPSTAGSPSFKENSYAQIGVKKPGDPFYVFDPDQSRTTWDAFMALSDAYSNTKYCLASFDFMLQDPSEVIGTNTNMWNANSNPSSGSNSLGYMSGGTLRVAPTKGTKVNFDNIYTYTVQENGTIEHKYRPSMFKYATFSVKDGSSYSIFSNVIRGIKKNSTSVGEVLSQLNVSDDATSVKVFNDTACTKEAANDDTVTNNTVFVIGSKGGFNIETLYNYYTPEPPSGSSDFKVNADWKDDNGYYYGYGDITAAQVKEKVTADVNATVQVLAKDGVTELADSNRIERGASIMVTSENGKSKTKKIFGDAKCRLLEPICTVNGLNEDKTLSDNASLDVSLDVDCFYPDERNEYALILSEYDGSEMLDCRMTPFKATTAGTSTIRATLARVTGACGKDAQDASLHAYYEGTSQFNNIWQWIAMGDNTVSKIYSFDFCNNDNKVSKNFQFQIGSTKKWIYISPKGEVTFSNDANGAVNDGSAAQKRPLLQKCELSKWYHIDVIMDTEYNIDIYIDGTLKGSLKTDNIGDFGGTAFNFNGGQDMSFYLDNAYFNIGKKEDLVAKIKTPGQSADAE